MFELLPSELVDQILMYLPTYVIEVLDVCCKRMRYKNDNRLKMLKFRGYPRNNHAECYVINSSTKPIKVIKSENLVRGDIILFDDLARGIISRNNFNYSLTNRNLLIYDGYKFNEDHSNFCILDNDIPEDYWNWTLFGIRINPKIMTDIKFELLKCSFRCSFIHLTQQYLISGSIRNLEFFKDLINQNKPIKVGCIGIHKFRFNKLGYK